jgi:hypothetical protein
VQARFYLIGALLVSGIPGCCVAQDQRPTHIEQPRPLFSPDPENIWNRLYRKIHVRSAQDGKEYGFADLDPLLWRNTKYLRNESDGDSNKRTLDLLDSFFLNAQAEHQVRDPVKRAILQRDLWAVYDWAVFSNLADKLGQVIWRLALSPLEINALPDTYAAAIRGKEFAAAYDASRAERAFLPVDLFEANGPWVCVSPSDGQLAAPVHESELSGRSVFLVLVRLRGGRQATLAYLKRLANSDVPLMIEGVVESSGAPIPCEHGICAGEKARLASGGRQSDVDANYGERTDPALLGYSLGCSCVRDQTGSSDALRWRQ